MKILICGNMGYVGPVLVNHLKAVFGSAVHLIGYDLGLFSGNLTDENIFPERELDVQFFGDLRNFPVEILKGIDIVIQLAAVSNDPMGKEFEQPTFQINSEAAIDLAKKAKKMGVKKYLYASSCSVYGAGGDLPKTEYDDLNPQTAYAISKISAENGLKELSSKDFKVICFRFATACGYSSRLRLDLVLNDFVSSAVMNGKIEILSDGSPLRPLIDVKDMSRAFEWGIVENVVEDFLVLNTGSNEWNFNVKELAFLVSKHFQKSIEIKINDKAAPDKRSYKVDFSKFKALAPNHYPQCCIESTVDDLIIGVNQNHNRFTDFRDGYLIRLNALRYLMLNKKINNNLEII